MRRLLALLTLAVGLLTGMQASAQFSIHDVFAKETMVNAAGERMPLRAWHKYEKKDLPVPVVVLLHGSGECGQDNASHLGPFASFHQAVLIDDKLPPALYLIPQCTKRNAWIRSVAFKEDYKMPRYPSPALRMVKEHLDHLVATGVADPKRLYIAGLSLGGFGTWDAIQRWPNTFAAAVPICAGGSVEEKAVQNALTTSIWVFHGSADAAVPVACSQRMVAALARAGKPPKYTEYTNMGHNVWTRALGDSAMLHWMFRQRLGEDDPGPPEEGLFSTIGDYLF